MAELRTLCTVLCAKIRNRTRTLAMFAAGTACCLAPWWTIARCATSGACWRSTSSAWRRHSTATGATTPAASPVCALYIYLDTYLQIYLHIYISRHVLGVLRVRVHGGPVQHGLSLHLLLWLLLRQHSDRNPGDWLGLEGVNKTWMKWTSSVMIYLCDILWYFKQ